ncbi:MAG: amino acid permease [Acetilactobacillus jinshanensis]
MAQLVSAGTLIAFMFVSVAVFKLSKHEGHDYLKRAFRVPGYPVLPIISFICS